MYELQEDEIYSDDSWLRLYELNKIENIIDDVLNVVFKEIYGKNRTSIKITGIDKHKDVDGYVSKLTDILNNYIKLINKVVETIHDVICEINNETNMIDEIIHQASEMDNDTLHLVDGKLNKIIARARKILNHKNNFKDE